MEMNDNEFGAQGVKLETFITVIFIHFLSLFIRFCTFSLVLQTIFKNELFTYVSFLKMGQKSEKEYE